MPFVDAHVSLILWYNRSTVRLSSDRCSVQQQRFDLSFDVRGVGGQGRADGIGYSGAKSGCQGNPA